MNRPVRTPIPPSLSDALGCRPLEQKDQLQVYCWTQSSTCVLPHSLILAQHNSPDSIAAVAVYLERLFCHHRGWSVGMWESHCPQTKCHGHLVVASYPNQVLSPSMYRDQDVLVLGLPLTGPMLAEMKKHVKSLDIVDSHESMLQFCPIQSSSPTRSPSPKVGIVPIRSPSPKVIAPTRSPSPKAIAPTRSPSPRVGIAPEPLHSPVHDGAIPSDTTRDPTPVRKPSPAVSHVPTPPRGPTPEPAPTYAALAAHGMPSVAPPPPPRPRTPLGVCPRFLVDPSKTTCELTWRAYRPRDMPFPRFLQWIGAFGHVQRSDESLNLVCSLRQGQMMTLSRITDWSEWWSSAEEDPDALLYKLSNPRESKALVRNASAHATLAHMRTLFCPTTQTTLRVALAVSKGFAAGEVARLLAEREGVDVGMVVHTCRGGYRVVCRTNRSHVDLSFLWKDRLWRDVGAIGWRWHVSFVLPHPTHSPVVLGQWFEQGKGPDAMPLTLGGLLV